jgi:hypothetical protein
MPRVRIHQRSKAATQSGKSRTHSWILEFIPEKPAHRESLVGWHSSSDMNRQVFLSFPTKEQAIAFAEKKGLSCQIEVPAQHTVKPKSYGDNFRYKV